MTATRLGLYELLAPQFLAGFTFPEYIDQYLSVLGVDELRAAFDESGVVYTGRVSFTGEAGAAPSRQHRDPSGAVFEWEDVTLDFRLTIPRDGAAPIDAAVTNSTLPLPDLDALFDTFGPVEQTPTLATDYPGVRFRLELLLSALTFHLGSAWKPGELGADFRIVPSTDPAFAGQDVRFVLPKVVFVYEQGDDPSHPPSFTLASWGNAGFDAPHDLAQGELVRMEPPIALHESGRFAFGIDQVLLDLSPDHTPPEILQFFGTDEAFQGLYFKSVRLFYNDPNKDLGLNIAVNDMLISFAGQVSLEASVDILTTIPLAGFGVTVLFFNGPDEIAYTRGTARDSAQPNVLTGGRARVPNTAVVQVRVQGGFPAYTISVRLDGTELWDGTRRDARISPGAPASLRTPGRYTLVVTVTDQAPTPNQYSQTIDLIVVAAEAELPASERDGGPLDRPAEAGERQPATLTINPADQPLPDGYAIRFTPSAAGIAETIVVEGGTTPHVRISSGSTTLIDRTLDGARQVAIDVPDGASYDLLIDYPASAAVSETFNLFFDVDKPYASGTQHSPQWPAVRDAYLADNFAQHTDASFAASRAPSSTTSLAGAAALRDWLQNRVIPPNAAAPKEVTVDADASFESVSLADHDQALTERRRELAIAIVGSLATVSGGSAHGHARASGAANPADRAARITGLTSRAAAAKTVRATLARPPRPAPSPPATTPVIRDAPAPQQLPTRRPTVLKRLSFRIRLERNIPVLIEFGGELDFETDLEQRLRTESGISGSDGDLGLQQRSGASANPNPQDGVVDFKLTITYDTATRQLTETLTLGAAPADIDGLLRMENPRSPGAPTLANRFKDIFGALLTFAPVTNNAAAAVASGAEGDWAALAVSLGVPVAIGALDIFRTRSVTLYGGELKFRQFLPSDTDPLRFTDAGIVFDYAVEFGITIELLGINTSRPLKVRYKAIGFNLHFEGGVTYQPIFDTSKGYEIDLSDPGLFNLPAPLGDLLRIADARIARFNPLTLDLDFALKADLGIVTVDRFKIKVPLDPPGVPMILPTGVRVNVPSTIVGSGYVNIIERTVGGVVQKGIEGALDVTIVPTKIRVAASLGVIALEDLALNRKAVAVFVGLVVEFPSPIVLFSTGLGIYGFSGLFAMHYKRAENPRPPGDSVSPALRWLERAGGEPNRLSTSSGDQLWIAEFDRWSFGIGLVLGTLDTGFLLNLRGMFVLELPGPRILIFVKVQIISLLPKLGDAELTVGILGVIDLDFNLGQLTIGVLIDYRIESLIAIQLPIEIFFKFNNLRQWHLYVGTISAPASAVILNLVRARGYFMIDGDKIDNFPFPTREDAMTLPGIAVATGLEASVIFGDEDVGLYLRVAAGAHLGVAFSPFFIVGNIYLDGELRLFIVSIEAHGTLLVKAPDPTYIHGEICGRVDFFFFSVEGCVGFTVGSDVRTLPAPALVRNLYLQSHAPVLTAGQGGDRPIDASLGDAVLLTALGAVPPGAQVPVVPIDTVPVIQFHASPRLASPLATFTAPIVPSPGLAVPDGWINAGGGRQLRYLLKEIALDPPLVLPGAVAPPPATWRREQSPGPQGANTNIDLALFSRAPVTAERALERSTELNTQVTTRWGDLCTPVAPPACVLWTFCRQPLGPSGSGWTLTGIAQPDPPGTNRTAPPPTRLFVEEPALNTTDAMLNLLLADAAQPFGMPARVIGLNPAPRDGAGERRCVDFQTEEHKEPNPFKTELATLLVRDFNGQPAAAARIARFGDFIGLDVGFTLEIELHEPAQQVEVTLVHFARPAKVEAFNADGTLADVAGMSGPGKQPETLTLRGAQIARLRVQAEQDETLLLQLCVASPEGKPGEGEDLACYRALQLPFSLRRQVAAPLPLNEELESYLKSRPSAQWINVHTGPAAVVRVFLAVAPRVLPAVVVAQLDASGATLDEAPLSALGPQPVSGTTTGLPPDWLAVPWQSQVLPVAQFLARPEFADLERLVFTLKPKPECTIVQIRIDRLPVVPPPHVIVAVVEVCSLAEQARAQQAEEIQSSEIETLTGYLNGGDPVPLLAPNTTYTLTIRYDAESKAEDGTITTEPDLRQRFRFKTDSRPPARLDPYVLGTTPDHEERCHFTDDPVKIVFNDIAIVQLYAAYGKQLRAVVRAADGTAIPSHEIAALDLVAGQVTTPYREAIEALVAAGLLPCVGSFTRPSHAEFVVPIPLRPLMSYTLDIELDPPDPAPSPPQPVTPLYRRQFATSKFANVAMLIAELRARRVRHRALTAPIGGLPGGSPAIATDQEIQDALVAAGEQALPAAEATGITVYWAPRAGGGFAPHAILIDAAEPLWRTRSEPRLETVPHQDDPAFKRVVPQRVPALEVVEQGGSAIARFVRSPGGTRTLAFIADTFSPPPGGAPITLAAQRHASALYNISARSDVIIALTLTAQAPWEDDHA